MKNEYEIAGTMARIKVTVEGRKEFVLVDSKEIIRIDNHFQGTIKCKKTISGKYVITAHDPLYSWVRLSDYILGVHDSSEYVVRTIEGAGLDLRGYNLERLEKRRENPYFINEEEGYISIDCRGKMVLIDIEDMKKVYLEAEDRVYVSKTGYAIVNYQGKQIPLHRFLMNAPKGSVVDHINNDRLDNRKSNLRITTTRVNCTNLQNRPTNGVQIIFDKTKDMWCLIYFENNTDVTSLYYFYTMEQLTSYLITNPPEKS